MKLLEWTKDALKNGVELFRSEIIIVNDNGVSIKRDTSRLRDICLGIVSSNDVEEWYRICRLTSPAGTIITPYEEEKDAWTSLFDDTTALVRNNLTKQLMLERSSKSAKTLLDILSKRDASHWSEKKTVEVDNKDSSNTISISIVGA